MKVIKRDGRIVEFNLDKIKLTLERVSDETEQPFPGSDIDKLSKEIIKRIKLRKTDPIKSSMIHDIVVNVLKDAGFYDIAQAYKSGKSK
ncbi:MAG: ATP cone domain-containing protein [Clostridia bacterium]|nr:ATP cone domain-containing protein [Clostridia bacterium]